MIADADLEYELVGDGKETILFLHGLFFDSDMFADQVKALSGDYRCLLINFPGHHAHVCVSKTQSIRSMSNNVAQLLQNLKISKCHIVGLSMGASIALAMTLERPEMTDSLTLIGASSHPEPIPRVYVLKALNFIGSLAGYSAASKFMIRQMFAKSYLSEPSNADEIDDWKNRISRRNPSIMYDVIGAVLNRPSMQDRLNDINVSTLVIAGVQDKVNKLKNARYIAETVPGAKFALLSEVGHIASLEAKQRTTKLLQDHLTQSMH